MFSPFSTDVGLVRNDGFGSVDFVQDKQPTMSAQQINNTQAVDLKPIADPTLMVGAGGSGGQTASGSGASKKSVKKRTTNKKNKSNKKKTSSKTKKSTASKSKKAKNKNHTFIINIICLTR